MGAIVQKYGRLSRNMDEQAEIDLQADLRRGYFLALRMAAAASLAALVRRGRGGTATGKAMAKRTPAPLERGRESRTTAFLLPGADVALGLHAELLELDLPEHRPLDRHRARGE